MEEQEIQNIIKKVLIYDIETAVAQDKPNPEKDHFRIFGAWSYKYNKYFFLTDLNKIQLLIDEHEVCVGHNSSYRESAYDQPILERHGISFRNVKTCDTLEISKKRLKSMMYLDVENYSLRGLAEFFEFPTQKGDLDYSILQKEPKEWNQSEKKEILTYLKADVEVTKLLFEKLIDYFGVFRQFVSQKEIENWGWIMRTPASLGYHIMCEYLSVEEEYGHGRSDEDIGGLVRTPSGGYFHNVWYIDVASLYPNIIIMFNMFGHPNLQSEDKNWFTGNEVFSIEGKYSTEKYSKMSEEFKTMFTQRKAIKKSNPRLATAYKILMNSGYGVLRSPMFKSTYYEHTGADICRLGQQINLLMSKHAEKNGFTTIYGDTDSIFIRDVQERDKETQRVALKQTIQDIKKFVLSNVPWPSDTFDIDIETGDMIDYIKFVYDEGRKQYIKKNYWYVYDSGQKIDMKGLPIKKTGSTQLGIFIYDKYLVPQIKNGKFGFKKSEIKSYIEKELEENIGLAARTINTKPVSSYKNPGQLQAQLSKEYLDGEGGKIDVIKNTKCGRAGKGFKYCTIEEAQRHRLKIHDIDLEKTWNELRPFIQKEQPIDFFAKTTKNDIDDQDIFRNTGGSFW